MPFKFEKLEVWQLGLDYIDLIYEIAHQLPRSEEYNLKSQITRAATSVALNIAEGSNGQTDAEQALFLGMAIRSLLETLACQHIISRREFLQPVVSTGCRSAARSLPQCRDAGGQTACHAKGDWTRAIMAARRSSSV